MDKTQFILSIVTNIVAAIIIWLCVRVTRQATVLLRSGTITTKVRQRLTPKTITILGSLLAACFNLVVLLRFIVGQASFTRTGTLSAITLTFISAYWVSRAASQTGIVKQLSDLRQSLEQERQRTEDFQHRIAELQEQHKDRRLTDDQLAFLVERLKGTPGNFDVRLGNGSNEVRDFSNDIGIALTRAGWKIQQRETQIGSAGPRGLRVIVQDPKTPRAGSLQKALEEIGFPAPGEVNPKLAKDSLILYIGEKLVQK
jgi:hypothetical protein